MQVIAAVAEFERDLLIERTQSGIQRAKAAGKRFGRRPSLNTRQQAAVLQRLDAGASIAEIAREFRTTRQTVMRVRDAALKSSSPKGGHPLVMRVQIRRHLARAGCLNDYKSLLSFRNPMGLLCHLFKFTQLAEASWHQTKIDLTLDILSGLKAGEDVN